MKSVVSTREPCSILVFGVCIGACDERDTKSREKKERERERERRDLSTFGDLCAKKTSECWII